MASRVLRTIRSSVPWRISDLLCPIAAPVACPQEYAAAPRRMSSDETREAFVGVSMPLNLPRVTSRFTFPRGERGKPRPLRDAPYVWPLARLHRKTDARPNPKGGDSLMRPKISHHHTQNLIDLWPV